MRVGALASVLCAVLAALCFSLGCGSSTEHKDEKDLKAEDKLAVLSVATAYCQAKAEPKAVKGGDVFAVQRDYSSAETCATSCEAFAQDHDSPRHGFFIEHGLGDISCTVYKDRKTVVGIGGHPDDFYQGADPAHCDYCCCRTGR